MDATFLDYFDMYSYYSAYCPYYQVIKLPLIYFMNTVESNVNLIV